MLSLEFNYPSSHWPELVTWPYPNKEGQEVYLTIGREGTDPGISVSCINGYKSICFFVVSFYLFLSLLNFLKVKDNSRI